MTESIENGNRIKFVADDNLLRQVITDQAGDWKKGILELMQNSYDSIVMKGNISATSTIEIKTKNDGDISMLSVEDWGCGWGNTQEEIIRNMKVFGNSVKKSIEGTIGEKGMGRGQAFAMIYNSSINEFVGEIEIQTNGWIIYDIKLSDLSFSIRRGGKGVSKLHGTIWTIKSSFRKFDQIEIMDYIEKNILLPVRITINDETIKRSVKGKKFETPYAIYYTKAAGGFDIYDRGMYVREKSFGGVGGIIITKVPLKLNFARNDIHDSDSNWKQIWNDAMISVKEHVISGTFTDDKKRAAAILVSKDSSLRWEFADMPIIRTAQGKFITPRTLQKYGTVYYSEVGNRIADSVIEQGGMVIDYDFISVARRYVSDILDMNDSTDSIVEYAKQSRYTEFAYEELTDKEKAYMHLLKKLEVGRDIRLGNRTGVLGWTDGSNVIWINRRTFAGFCKFDPIPAVFYMRSIPLVAHEMAHDNDDRDTDTHGYQFEKTNLDWVEELLIRASRLEDVKNGVQ